MGRKIGSRYAISLATGAGLLLDLPGDSFLSSEGGQYGASNDVLSSRNWQYGASNDVLSSGNVLLSHNAGLGGGSYIRRVLRVRSCSCDPTIAGIRGSLTVKWLSKNAQNLDVNVKIS